MALGYPEAKKCKDGEGETATPFKVGILGSGNWGSAIAINVGENARAHRIFQDEVKIWVFEEEIDGRKLTDIINSDHENVKYLPGYKLPENIRAVPDAVDVVQDADILVIVLPHQFLPRLLSSIKEHVKKDAVIVSLIKGQLDIEQQEGQNPRIELGSDIIQRTLGIPCGVLMGANVASNVAAKEFTESTLALPASCEKSLPPGMLDAVQKCFHLPTFLVGQVADVPTVELCGGLKNIVALGAGFCDGLGYGIEAKAAVIRMGLIEMERFVKNFFPTKSPEEEAMRRKTLFESCGFGDLLTTCFGGRNRKCAEAFARNPSKGWVAIESELLNGQKLQGTLCCQEVVEMFRKAEMSSAPADFPLFHVIHKIAFENGSFDELLKVANNTSSDDSSSWNIKCQDLSLALVDAVGTASGFCDGLGMGSNTKASVMRLAGTEACSLLRLKFPQDKLDDAEFALFSPFVVSSYSSEDRKLGELFAQSNSDVLLSTRPWCGQVKMALDNGNHHAKFPMMSHMLKIAYGSEPAKKVLPCEW